MELLSSLYTEVLWRPLFNGLVLFYWIVPGHDAGLAVIGLSAALRLALAPLLWKAHKSQKALAALQPEVKKIQDRFKGDRESQGKALMELYAHRGVSPFSGFGALMLQLPILIALFQVFQQGFDAAGLTYLYSFVPNPGAIDPVSFGLVDLSRGGLHGLFLGAAAALTQFYQSSISTPASSPAGGGSDFSRALAWQTKYIFPLFVFGWSYTLPAALTLYWTVLNIFGIVQELAAQRFSSVSAPPSAADKITPAKSP